LNQISLVFQHTPSACVAARTLKNLWEGVCIDFSKKNKKHNNT